MSDVWLTSNLNQDILNLCSIWRFHCCSSISPEALEQSHCFTGMINPRLHPTEVKGILSDGPSRQLLDPSLCTTLWCNISALHRKNMKQGRGNLGYHGLLNCFLKLLITNALLFCISLCRLFTSNTFDVISDDAFMGLPHLEYLWVDKSIFPGIIE